MTVKKEPIEQPFAAINHDERGRFAKGNKVVAPNRGRPARADIMPVLIAVTEEFTVDELRQMLRDTWATAVEKEDWKGMYAVVNFVVQYAVGKPVQRTLTAHFDPEQALRMFTDPPAELDEDDVEIG